MPPLPEAVIVPVPPLQSIFVVTLPVEVTSGGLVILVTTVSLQPLLSVTVTV